MKALKWGSPDLGAKYTVEEIPAGLASGKKVAKGQTLMVMFDFELAKQIMEELT